MVYEKIFNSFFSFLFFSFLFLNAQDVKSGTCATDELHLKNLKENPDYLKKFEDNTVQWQEYAQRQPKNYEKLKEFDQVVQVPPNVTNLTVAFHDLTNSNSYLIPSTASLTDYQYIIDKLNLIFNGTNLNGTVGNNTFIQFCMARRNQNNINYTVNLSHHPGISQAAGLNNADQSMIEALVDASNSQSTFNPNKYINIYIVDDILGSVAGFATLPSSHGNKIDGIYIERNYLINNSSLNTNMNVLAHEMGHYLGLFHTFGICQQSFEICSCTNSNCLFDGDMVCDTPPNQLQANGYFQDSFPNTCITDATFTISDGSTNNPTTDVNDPKDNFMDYGVWAWQKKFTIGQITRMNFMVDQISGPRKALLGQAPCIDCDAMLNCSFTISTSPVLENPKHYITQNSNFETPLVQINLVGPCITSPNPNLQYIWILNSVNSPNPISYSGVGSNYTTIPSLATGNYQLIISAILISNNQCVTNTTYNFCVIPNAGVCNLIVPNSNSLNDWINTNWERNSFSNGWVLNTSTNNYPVGSTHFNNTQTDFDQSGFDVIQLTPGNSISSSIDPVLGGIPLPSDANITRVMKVGKLQNGGGQAFYAKRTLIINNNNCRFRVWYLGATQGSQSLIKYPFHNEFIQNDAAFGILNKYKYNSSVNTVMSSYNTTIGIDDINQSSVGIYGKFFDVISLINGNPNSNCPDLPSVFGPYNLSPHNGYKKMLQWKFIDLDYSEFLNMSPNTEITVTFFSHSNIANPAHQNAYAYYGIECLGGGSPEVFTLEIPNLSAPCGSPGIESCAFIPLPIPKVVAFPSNLTSTSYNFANVKIDMIDTNGTVLINSYPFVSTSQNSITGIKICLTDDDVPFRDFRITYRTLQGEFTDEFRIFVSFYNNIPDCATGDNVDTLFHSGIVNGDILLCGVNNLPNLHLTPTCITQPKTYQWYRKNNINNIFMPIDGATNETLQLSYTPPFPLFSPLTLSNNYTPNQCNTYKRIVAYKEPYCGRPKTKESEEFHIYNSETLKFNFSIFGEQDVCFGNDYSVSFSSAFLNNVIYSCNIPNHFNLSNVQNSLTFQLFDPVSNQLIGTTFTHNFNGTIQNQLNLPNFNLVFNNINPSTGNTPLFLPTATGTNQFPVELHISGNYLNCPVGIEHPIDPLQNSGSLGNISYSPTAVGGAINYNCNNLSINNVDIGITFTGYGWEYSNNGINYNPIPLSPNTASLPSSFINSLINSNPILYIRRVSFGNPNSECIAPNYSNVVIITNHPTSVIFNATLLPTTICNGSNTFTLPTTSSNGIIGTWNVATINNTTSAIYTFTPAAGYCLPPYTYNLTVTNTLVPTFNSIIPICAGQNFTLPTTSLNGVTGTWLPNVNNTITTTYTFTPTSGGCSSNLINLTVVVNPLATISFNNSNISTSFCTGSTAPILPLVDDNGITGTWSPSVVSNTISGVYVFTPSQGQCANAFSLNITVIAIPCGFTLSWDSDVSCQQANEDPRVKDENIVDGPCIRVCENSTITFNINGNYIGIDYTEWNITGGTIINSTNTSCQITWSTDSFYALQGTIHLVNGTTISINRCIEKLNAPIALFGIMPDVGATIVYGCKTSDLVFENLTTNNNGHQTIYYNWDFGDGTTSNEFEPIHNYNSSGTYNVTLTVFNGCSCSSIYTLTVIVNEGNVPIQCPSVACEDEVATYSVPEYIASSCSIHWTVIGGEIVGHNSTFTLIDVLWNNIDSDGFGYVSVDENNCFTCSTVIKIPVVQKLGTIKGNATVCQKSQNLYSLPKWPTTQFNWTLNNNGTGAYLIENNQNNEIIIYSDSVGTVDLYCTYFNTLLSCGGSAHLQIQVRPNIISIGSSTVCTNTNETYSFTDADGNLISSINWSITGPNNFIINGNTSPLDVTFPTVGIYNITTSSTDFCSSMHPITVTDKPQPPTAIIGSLFVCPGVPSIYSATPVAGSTTHWQVSNGSFLGSNIGDEVSIMFNPTVAGPYQVNVWYETEFCPTDLYSISVDRQPVDLILTQTQSPVCGSSFATYAIADANADSYNWSIIPESAGSINTGQNTNEISILWNQFNGAAHVKIEVVRCSTTYLVQYLIQVINAPTVTISGATNVCKGVNTNFTLSLAPSSTFDYVEWNFGDGTTQTVNYVNASSLTTSHQYNDPLLVNTNYQVTATVYGGNGCIMPATATFNVTVSPTPVIYLTPTNGLNICSPAITTASYNYSVNIQSGFAGTNTIQWYHNGNSIAAETNLTINVQPYGVGSYYATVTNIFNCTATTQTFYVTNECGGCSAPYQVDAAVINTVCNGFQATATVIEGTPISVNWASVNFPGATIVNNTPYNLTVDNVQPGQYTIQLIANYYINGSTCAKTKDVTFTIPYKAGLKYNVSCNGSSYNVQLLDFSVYYPETPIEHFAFTIDNGLNWYPATIVGGIPQFNTTLTPGSYQIGIKIYSAGYAHCTHYETLLLPAMPSAAFTASTNNCQDNAVQFTALDNSPDLQYYWSFNDGSYNLQQNPVRVFNGFDDFAIQLTVTNKYGCSAISTQFVNVMPVNMLGSLEQTPVLPCEGNSTTLHYNNEQSEIPVSITWYHDSIEAPPLATTIAPNLDLTVNQSGYYIAHLTDANGCVYKYTLAIPVGFVPIPDIPTITGASMVCEGGNITVSVPVNNSVVYNWSINGMAQPIYNGLSTITIYSASLGFYNISVTATVPNGSGGSCSSPPANIVISVVPPPATPQLSFQVITCEPYLVQVDVNNIQTDVMYYWSNGVSGPTAYITHDGPIQVRAEINGCTATAQLDLPIDLQAIAWVFPAGCFENCQRDPLGYIIGPNGDFNSWSWLQDGEVVSTGSNEILSFNNVVPTHDYQLIIDNGFCTQTIENLNIQLVRCQKCEIRYNILTIECDKINNEYVYSIEILTDNPYTSTVFMNFLASNGEGFFVNSNLTIPPGLTNHLFYFYPLNGFTGGDVMVEISGDLNPQTRCVRQLLFRFPPCVDELPRIAVINQSITMLLVAPNPAHEQTKVFYGFNSVNNSTAKKTLEVIDLLGRTILTHNLEKTKGIETLDTSRYAAGQYLVILKEDDVIIKSVKLIINK